MHKAMFEFVSYILLGIRISYIITGLVFFLVDLSLRVFINGLYIYLLLLISATDLRQFDIILVYTMCLKFLKFGSPKIMYIFLANLALSVCLFVNPTLFPSTVVTIFYFAVVYVVLNTYIPCLFFLNLIIPLLV